MPLNEKRVLLIDDVITTGATISEMARAVTEAGGVAVTFITVAETLPKSHTNFNKKV
jgi:predicted amidophosphoribosyltransferase